MNKKEFLNKDLVKKSIIKILKKDSKLKLIDIDDFSRKMPTFYPTLCVEMYGQYSNKSEYFNKARRLFRFLTNDKEFNQEIKSININDESINDDQTGDDFSFQELKELTIEEINKNSLNKFINRNEIKVLIEKIFDKYKLVTNFFKFKGFKT
jgi:hypothetical protein